MSQDQGASGRKGAKQLCRLAIVEVVKTVPERLTVDGDDMSFSLRRFRIRTLRGVIYGLQKFSVPTKCLFDSLSGKSSKNVADRRIRWRPFPRQAERRIQAGPVRLHESVDTPVRIGSSHDGQDRKQQHIGKLIDLAFFSSGISNLVKKSKKRAERIHGNLQLIRLPDIESHAGWH